MTRRSLSSALPFAALAPATIAKADISPGFAIGGSFIAVEWFPAAGVDPGATAPALLLLHGADGITYADSYRFGAGILAGAGYHVAFPHYLDRTGDRRVAYGRLRQDYPLWADTVRGGLGWLATQQGVDANRLGIVGISLGAALALSVAAEDRRIKALVGYSGPCPDELESAGGSLPPTLILHGQRDRVVPVSNACRIVELLAKNGTRHEAHIYPDQGHVFVGLARLDAAARASTFFDRFLKSA